MKKAVFLMAVAMMFVLTGCNFSFRGNEADQEGDRMEVVDSPEALFDVIGEAISKNQEPRQIIRMVDLLVTDYPDYENNPVALFMLASFVYDEQLHDLDKARETYQRIIDEYPDCPFANDAAIAITQLGMTPEELVRMFEEQAQE